MTRPVRDERNAAEIDYWNGPGGQRWLNQQQVHDALLAPVAEVLLARAAARAGETILDVGCGCGTTSIALAQSVAPGGHVLGVDVSALLLEQARRRAPPGLPLSFTLADATVYPFEPGRADLLCSRFGVMFFSDPERSFANMRSGLRAGARLVFTCWREPRENPWLMVPLQEACRHVPRLPEVGPEEPGPYSLADPRRVRTILERAGFGAVRLDPLDLPFDLAAGRGLDAAVDTALNIGPAGRALDGQPAPLRAAAAESIRAALARYQVGCTVPLPGSAWLVTATNP
ncbi:MAG TPA: class I SAM-dependent methyltransferase [Steroidobacteraceae bacterium]|jgi:SAM-dependent methyltransferase|nr:class I SAM-dependent methyltransferase [Steroidobacteraceae bacterium]